MSNHVDITAAEAAVVRIQRVSNFAVAGIWIYQGLVPKLLGPHQDELAMSSAFGIPLYAQAPVSYAAGAGEVVLGLVILLLPDRAWPQIVSALSTAVLLAFVTIYAPHFLVGAFNPVVMNGASIALSIAALLAMKAQASQLH